MRLKAALLAVLAAGLVACPSQRSVLPGPSASPHEHPEYALRDHEHPGPPPSDDGCLPPDGTSAQVKINAALGTTGREAVELCAGTFVIDGPVLVPRQSRLSGAGMATTEIEASGSWSPPQGTPMVAPLDQNHDTVEVDHLTLDGQNRGVTGWAADHPNPDKSQWASPPDVIHFVHDLIIRNTWDGIFADGAEGRGAKYGNLRIFNAQHYGVYASAADTHWTNIDIGSSGSVGFYIDSSQNHAANVKSWFSDSHGFEIRGTRNSFTNCEAQDNAGNGWDIPFGKNLYAGVAADSNGYPPPELSPVAGFDIRGSGSILQGLMSYDKCQGGTCKQEYGIRWGSGVRATILDGVVYGNTIAPETGPRPSDAQSRIFVAQGS
jgi:hypothetical protein